MLLAAAIFVGATTQRLTGMGFALVAAPFVVLIIGPVTGVVLVNICGVLASGLVIPRVFRHVNWRKYVVLASAALLGVIPGAVIVKYVPGSWLQVGVGLIVLVSLTISLRMKTFKPEVGLKPMIVAGSVSGIMNTTAGVGGPAMSVYAIASKWEQESFAATMQPYFLTIGLASIAAKYVASPLSMPQLEPWAWAVIAGAIVAGLIVGELLSRWVTQRRARFLVILLAYAGAMVATVQGVSHIFAG